MVAGSVAAFLVEGGVASPSSKCRYKTGKCTNTRSSKRNGQPHQLCLYHREKANKIQRKFDRQKRQVAKVKRSSAASGVASRTMAAGSSALGTPTAGNIMDLDPAAVFALSSPFGTSGVLASPSASSSSSSSSSFATLAAHDVDIYSDSDSSRFSTDSESSIVLDQVWADLPRSAMQLLQGDELASPAAGLVASSAAVGCHQSYLSSDELDFLCSAILE